MEKAREGEREAHGESVACGPSALPLLRDQGGGSGQPSLRDAPAPTECLKHGPAS